MNHKTSRRNFIKASALGVGLSAITGTAQASQKKSSAMPSASYRSAEGYASPAMARVRIAFVGVGLQGGSHVRNFLKIDKVEIKAICDIDETRAREVRGWVAQSGKPEPDLYTRGETDFKRLCQRDDIDLIFNSTPWKWHVPVCVEAMNTGKHAAVEVPAAFTVDGCWELVETAERTDRHCVMMENCCYGRAEMMVLRMVRSGLFGELLHAEGAYIHDLRAIKFSNKNEGLWRWAHSAERNGNLYPTHGLGPVAQCMDINRGDQFDYLVSMSSNARGMNLYAQKNLAADDPRRAKNYILGDMNSSLIRTKAGRTILVQHDTTTPRPYSRINLVQGTRGVFRGYPDRIFIEGETRDHQWEDAAAYREKYEHPLWRDLERKAAGAGHGGMDFLEDYRLIQCLLTGAAMDMDVYDAAAWSVVTALSEDSVANRGRPVDFPDFTRGRWKTRAPLGIVSA